MKHTPLQPLCVATVLFASLAASATESAPLNLRLTGDWQLRVTVPARAVGETAKAGTATLDVSPPTIVTVRAEKYDRLPLLNPQAAGWVKGVRLAGVVACECTVRGLLDPASLQLRAGPQPDAPQFELGKDFGADLEWASIGRLTGGRIGENQPVYASYRHALLRIDSIVLGPDGRIELHKGKPEVATPVPPTPARGECRLANLWIAGRLGKLEPRNLFPILETAYPEAPAASPSPAERRLPRTMHKLREGRPLRILAWGDSVTACGYLPDAERWQAQFAARLQRQFPQAKIELLTEAWGGRSTTSYLAEPPGSEHNYREKVLGARPDLVISEFVNDAGLTPPQVEERYGKFQADFAAIATEWIILTPHYVRPDWMGLTTEREIDADPRPYVTGLRQFSARHGVALADASLRWGRLWRQGIPYSSLFCNAINHPNAHGMRLFADSLMALFPGKGNCYGSGE
jgi:lysophospholipase L1-like esterase